MIAGAIVVIAGSLLPWLRVDAGNIGWISVLGVQRAGKFTLLLGVAQLVAAANYARRPEKDAGLAISLLGLAVVVIGVIDAVLMLGVVGENRGFLNARLSVGLPTMLIGTLIFVAGVALRSSEAKPELPS